MRAKAGKAVALLCLCLQAARGHDWSAIPVPADAGGQGKSWELQEDVSDDFNYYFAAANSKTHFGENKKWYNFYHNGWDGPGTTYWQYNHVAVQGGKLVIKSSRNPSTKKMGVEGVNAGCITSTSQVQYPVFVEASVSVANIALASDVWLLSPDDTQEIDIIECYGGADHGNAYFAERVHLSHHSFVRQPFTDYQPKDWGSWYQQDGVKSWGDYCWNNGQRKYIRTGVYWISPTHFEYYIDGKIVRVLYNNAFASKDKWGKWHYTYPSGNDVKTHSASYGGYSFEALKRASAVSQTNVIDPFNYQKGQNFWKPEDIIINVESQDWHVKAGRTPSTSDLNNPAKNTMLVDWIRVYKPSSTPVQTPLPSTPTPTRAYTPPPSTRTPVPVPTARPTAPTPTGGTSIVIEAEGFVSTGGTFNDGRTRSGVVANGNGINNVNRGDWAEYEVTVSKGGVYSVEYFISTPMDNAAVRLYVDGTVVRNTNVPNNGDWWKLVVLKGGEVTLSQGRHVVKIEGSGLNPWQWNMDKIKLNFVRTAPSGSSKLIVIEAESYVNTGGTYADGRGVPGVDSNEVGINHVNRGDFVDYEFNVDVTGVYSVKYFISTPMDNTAIRLYVDGQVVSNTPVQNNGEWGSFVGLEGGKVKLTHGRHTMRIEGSGSNEWQWNLDKTEFRLDEPSVSACGESIGKWGNCFKKSKCCATGLTCREINRWYSQCV